MENINKKTEQADLNGLLFPARWVMRISHNLPLKKRERKRISFGKIDLFSHLFFETGT